MARGWESKSVESQQEDRRPPEGPARSAEDRERAAKRESLEMSRRRISKELEGSRSATHRAALENALRHLDEELGKLG